MNTPTQTSKDFSLEQALDFQDENILFRFESLFDLQRDDVEDIFQETKKWLYLLASAAKERERGRAIPRLTIDDSLVIVDEMWHNFILFTSEYHDYCLSTFGSYLHHGPTTKTALERAYSERSKNEKAYFEKYERRLKGQYEYICEKLGQETLEKWYVEYPQKYSVQVVNTIRKDL